MENKIVTLTSKQFGKVRTISEESGYLFCASDVAKALGYAKPNNAISMHCRSALKRGTPHPQSENKQIEMLFIPECDVYRLICHSKLPAALEFEKWVFEDVVPKAVRNQTTQKATQGEQLTLETKEYFYFDKTYGGAPIVSLVDIEHFTGLSKDNIYTFLKSHGIVGKDYFKLDGSSLSAFKAENPSFPKACVRWYYIVTKDGFAKLLKKFKSKSEMPKCFIEEKKVEKASKDNKSVSDCVNALGVLGTIREKLTRAENTEAVTAIEIAIKYTAWELSTRVMR